MEGWPAEKLAGGNAKPGVLPADGGQAGWSVVLPPTPEPITASDILQEPGGRRYLVRSAEQTEMGWRLLIRGTEV